jgi:hypothetical protein
MSGKLEAAWNQSPVLAVRLTPGTRVRKLQRDVSVFVVVISGVLVEGRSQSPVLAVNPISGIKRRRLPMPEWIIQTLYSAALGALGWALIVILCYCITLLTNKLLTAKVVLANQRLLNIELKVAVEEGKVVSMEEYKEFKRRAEGGL